MADTVLQKSWYKIQLPDMFTEDELTETPAEKDTQVIGRRVSADLSEVLEDTDKYFVDVTFRVTDVEGNKAFTEVDGMECSSEYVSRMIRKRSDRMDLVVDTETSDEYEVRVKIVGATVASASSNTLSDVRNTIEDIIHERAGEMTYHDFMGAIFRDELQQELREEVEDIYPFRELEVRKTELRSHEE